MSGSGARGASDRADAAFDRAFELAPRLFHEIGMRTRADRGVTRAPYDSGESAALEILSAEACAHGLQVGTDAAANLYMTVPGAEPESPCLIIGSHLDSVPNGGNYDGLAGVVAGLVVAAALCTANERPRRDLIVLGLRGEENAWFGVQHIGSRAALGELPPELLDQARRIDTGRTLESHMAEAGCDLVAVREGRAALHNDAIHRYYELHIEQGPMLESLGRAVGVVTQIRGNRRYPDARCVGAYGHSGTVPRPLRHDAVAATAELVTEMNRRWEASELAGVDLVLTFGRFFTDPSAHGVTVIPGDVRFSFDARSHSPEALDEVERQLGAVGADVEARHGVRFEWGTSSGRGPVAMDPAARGELTAACGRLGIEPVSLASGADHDASDFIRAGVPAGMIFVRSYGGSHNPDEHMELEDFRSATRVLLETVLATR
jgi:N-carbamoyl-L-amino-acid hydrolase